MAGSLAVVTTSQQCRKPTAADCVQWQVWFARFFMHPVAASTCQSLVPPSKKKRGGPPRGTWMSSSSSTASLKIFKEDSSSDAILTVDMCGKLLEEHYISSLNFSWPQISCVPGFSSRGSRAVFVSYQDSSNEIQKFALRFSTDHDVYIFIATLKVNLKVLIELQKSDHRAELSYQSEFMSTRKLSSRESKVDSEILTPLDTCAPQMQMNWNSEVEQPSRTPETVHGHNPSDQSDSLIKFYVPEMPRILEDEVEQPVLFIQQTEHNHNPNPVFSSQPTSFTSLLSGFISRAKQDAAQTELGQEVSLKSQIMMPENETEQPLCIQEIGQPLCIQETEHIPHPNPVFSSLPPSFTSLLSGCVSEAEQDAGEMELNQEIDLKSQIMKYMEDSAFQELLFKVERAIDEIEGNLPL